MDEKLLSSVCELWRKECKLPKLADFSEYKLDELTDKKCTEELLGYSILGKDDSSIESINRLEKNLVNYKELLLVILSFPNMERVLLVKGYTW
jgi:hypothetical protein